MEQSAGLFLYIGDEMIAERCSKCGEKIYYLDSVIYAGLNIYHIACPQFKEKHNMAENKIRQFDTGATRDTDMGKLDYEGFISPLVLERYAQYLHKHRVQSDGKLRDSDNWQNGMPIEEYMKSKVRHSMYTWLLHRGFPAVDEKGNEVDLEDSLCAEIFNAMGILFELLKCN